MKHKSKIEMLIAVSGGPDSMALFDMARRYGISLVCMHVNYQKRDSANRDEMIVAKYCEKYQIPFIKINAGLHKGNFQKWARDFRYDFFKKVSSRYNINKVLMAHQLDDYLETLIMQIKRGSMSYNYGIKSIIEEFGLKIYRPLLKYTKADLLYYCEVNQIAYGIDESNLEDHYSRNRIRHQIIDYLNYCTKYQLYKDIETINYKRQLYLDEQYNRYIKNIYTIEEIKNINNLYDFLRVKLYQDLSIDYLKEIKRQILNADSFIFDIHNKTISKYRDKLYFDEKVEDYEYIIDNFKLCKTKYFEIVNNADSFRSLTLSNDDFPIKIRNFKKGDTIEMLYGKKHIARFFIDNKIPLIWRKRWPIVENVNGDIIMVPGIGCNKSHYSIKPNFFMIELLNMEDNSCTQISKKS